MSLRVAPLLLAASLAGCFLPDDYNPCGGPCPDSGGPVTTVRRDAGDPDVGPTLSRALGATRTATQPPPPLAGGTLLALRAAGRAVLADPDTDSLRVLDTTLPAQIGELALMPHDEPGRAVEDAAGRVHVVLRGGGAIVTIDPSDPSAPMITARRAVCPVPRGIAYDAVADVLYVACAGGELVTLPPVGAALRTAHLEDDLRDVIVQGAELLVTRFRSADVLVVDPIAGVVSRTVPLPTLTTGVHRMEPEVAWRALAMPRGGAMVLHQLARADAVPQATTGFGDAACDHAIVEARLTQLRGAMAGAGVTLPCAVLAVDAAIAPDASAVTVALAGAAPLDPCHPLATYALRSGGTFASARAADCMALAGRVVAVAHASDGTLLAQTRAPLALVVSSGGVTRELQLPGAVVGDTGFDVFHAGTTDHVACASCHPEGGEDGRVWLFDAGEPRRTMSLRGGLLATAPFDWHGDRPSVASVFGDVFTRQMGGGTLSAEQLDAAGRWLDVQSALPMRTIEDADAVTRGAALFASAATGCSGCHSGARLSNQATLDVGTGGTFQVPSLRGVSYRAPYFHDGCAASLADTLDACGAGDRHGVTSALSSAERADLLAYLAAL